MAGHPRSILCSATLIWASCATATDPDDLRPLFFHPSAVEVTTELNVESVTRTSNSILSAESGPRAAARSVLAIRSSADLEAWGSGDVSGELVLELRANRGRAAVLNAAQGTSTLDAPDANQVNEAFYKNSFLRDTLHWRVGLLDGNSEFAAIDATEAFLNPAPATSPSIAGIPTWPFTAPGSELIVDTTDDISLGLGAYDTRFVQSFETSDEQIEAPTEGGGFFVGELRYSLGDQLRSVLGAWHETSGYETTRGDRASGQSGSYASIESTLLGGDSEDPLADNTLRAFAFAGLASSRGVEVQSHTAAGLVWSGFWPRRTEDSTGIAWSSTQVAPETGIDRETSVEAFYQAALGDSAVITISAQWVTQAGGAASDDELLLGLRGSLSL